MRYRPGQPKNDLAKALYLSKEDEMRLTKAIEKVFASIHSDRSKNDFSIDEINSLVAPYIKTVEEAYFVAQCVTTSVIQAYQEYTQNVN